VAVRKHVNHVREPFAVQVLYLHFATSRNVSDQVRLEVALRVGDAARQLAQQLRLALDVVESAEEHSDVALQHVVERNGLLREGQHAAMAVLRVRPRASAHHGVLGNERKERGVMMNDTLAMSAEESLQKRCGSAGEALWKRWESVAEALQKKRGRNATEARKKHCSSAAEAQEAR
jgi:hypothetical protein